jgi:uncharacterized damage-inducible protein DinB
MIAPEIVRPPQPVAAGERELLDGWLEFHRATLLHKCAGLDDDQLRRRACPPSTLSLLGLVRHMAEVERSWFGRFVGAQEPHLYASDEWPDADFDDLDQADAAADFAVFERECARSRERAAGHDLDETFTSRRRHTLSLRWIYVHMIEEYARHNGHADLIRQAIDGTVGV